jgi:hypothetical protein
MTSARRRVCALADRWTGIAGGARHIGRVPFAFYALPVDTYDGRPARHRAGFDARQFFTIFFFFPKGYGVGLPGVFALGGCRHRLIRSADGGGGKAKEARWWLSYGSSPIVMTTFPL